MTTNTEGGLIPTELSKDDLLKYVELDLWRRFQERLWKIVGIVLTMVTVVGFLGVPYYIKNEVSDTLQKQATDFKQRTDAILSQAKLLTILTAQYDSERYRFDSDVYRLIDAIKKFRAASGTEQPKHRFNDPEEELAQLISRRDFSKVVDGSAMMTRGVFAVPKDLKEQRILPQTSYMVENRGLQGSGGYSETHPVRNGTYEGAIRDLRFRVVALEVLRRTIAASQDKLLALGGVTEIERRVETVRVKSLESTEFGEAAIKELAAVANSFLSHDDQREFARVQSLYLPFEGPRYQASSAATKAGAPESGERKN
jgi:hypothetical protein